MNNFISATQKDLAACENNISLLPLRKKLVLEEFINYCLLLDPKCFSSYTSTVVLRYLVRHGILIKPAVGIQHNGSQLVDILMMLRMRKNYI